MLMYHMVAFGYYIKIEEMDTMRIERTCPLVLTVLKEYKFTPRTILETDLIYVIVFKPNMFLSLLFSDTKQTQPIDDEQVGEKEKQTKPCSLIK